jgi:hypothetical protein
LLGLEIKGPDLLTIKARTREIVNVLAGRAQILTGAEGPAANIPKLRPPWCFAKNTPSAWRGRPTPPQRALSRR